MRLESARAPNCLEWLLELTDSIITYRSRYMAQPELLPALDLIVLDSANPHAVIFQLRNLIRYIDRLQRELPLLPDEAGDDALRINMERLLAFDLNCVGDYKQSVCQDCGSCTALAGLLEGIANDAAALSDRLAMRYFTHIGDVGRQTLAA